MVLRVQLSLRSTRDQFLTGQRVDACSTRARPLTNNLYVIQIILQFHCRCIRGATTYRDYVDRICLEIYVEATTYRVQVHTVATKCIVVFIEFTCLIGSIGLATKWLRVLSLGGNDKTRNHLVANPIATLNFVSVTSIFAWLRIFMLRKWSIETGKKICPLANTYIL